MSLLSTLPCMPLKTVLFKYPVQKRGHRKIPLTPRLRVILVIRVIREARLDLLGAKKTSNPKSQKWTSNFLRFDMVLFARLRETENRNKLLRTFY